MTQSGDPLENAVAERTNGILNTELLYKMTIGTREECRSEFERIIGFYNTERPYMSIGLRRWLHAVRAAAKMLEKRMDCDVG